MRFGYSLFLIISTAGLLGCSDGGESVSMANVSGIVTLKGKPLADAEVYFLSGKFEGYGQTDAEGRYALVRGAPVGDCKVYITKKETAPMSSGGIDLSIEGMNEGQIQAMQEAQEKRPNGSQTPPSLPAEFSDPQQTKLSFTVPPGGTDDANFNL